MILPPLLHILHYIYTFLTCFKLRNTLLSYTSWRLVQILCLCLGKSLKSEKEKKKIIKVYSILSVKYWCFGYFPIQGLCENWVDFSPKCGYYFQEVEIWLYIDLI